MKHIWWLILACLFLLPILASAHEISFEDKICVCAGDLNGNMVVDEVDLQILLDCFKGQCTEPCEGNNCPELEEHECTEQNGCYADLNHSHEVGRGDVAVLLGNWGDCPKPGDVNDDGVADLEDIVKVQADMGNDCTQDLDYEGRVGGNDLAIAEAAWGPGDDHHPGTDLNRDKVLSIAELISVFNSQGRDCRSDIDDNGSINIVDLCFVCGRTTEDCQDYGCPP